MSSLGFQSIKFKLIVMFVLAGSVPMLMSIFLIHIQSNQIMQQQVTAELTESVIARDLILEEHIDEVRLNADVIASLPSMISFADAAQNKNVIPDHVLELAGNELALFQERMWGRTHHIMLLDVNGQVILNAPHDGWLGGNTSTLSMQLNHGKHLGKTIEFNGQSMSAVTETSASGYFDYIDDGHFFQLVASPIKDTIGQVAGYVVLEVSIEFIQEIVHSAFQIGETGKLFVVSREGREIHHDVSAYSGHVHEGIKFDDAFRAGKPLIGKYIAESGQEVIGAFVSSHDGSWGVIAEIDAAEVEAPVRAQYRMFLIITGLGFCGFGTLIVFTGRMFWKPMREVVVAAERVADGDVWLEIDTTRSDEIGELQSAVDMMRLSLKQQIDHLDSTVAERTAELEYANEQLHHDSVHDKLTGLANRVVLTEMLNKEILQYKSDSSNLISVMFFDFDRFKVVNDSLGHAVGDSLLCSIADRFNNELRDTDLAARFGGDEFVVMLSSVNGEQEVHEAADRLLKLFEEPHIISGHRIVSTASIGLVIADPRYENADEMIRDADTAMYEAKLAGKGQVVLFDEQLYKDALFRQKLEEELPFVVDQDQLKLMYQPIIGLDGMVVLGVESLIRWEHPTLGLISPDKFVPIAEDTGQIIEIGEWILRESVNQLIEWDQAFGLDGSHTVNVNVAKRQLCHPNFIAMLTDVLKKSGLDPMRLKVEITESTVMDPRHDMGKVIKQIRDLGVMLAMDDFGTGHSSLSLLHEFDFDILKIDQSFIQGMEQSREMSAVMHSIIQLAKNTGMCVVAEGVESESQVACLISHECDMIQGYYFARPLDANEAGKFLSFPIEVELAA